MRLVKVSSRDARFLDLLHIFFLVFTFITFILLSTFIGVFYKTMNTSIPSVLCLPFIDPSNSNIFIKIITIFIGICQILASLLICLSYLFLVTVLRQTKYGLQKSKNTSKSGVILQLLIVTASNLLCWIPSNTIYLLSLFLSRYPIDILIWTTIAVTPVNSIVNPTVFIVTTLGTK